MGLQSKHTANGVSVLVIDQACDNDQLLVSLSKNDAQWLSPIGWTDQQKVTLLDCRANGETTEVDIPAKFASDIKSGDVLVLRCSELDFEKEITWEASQIETRGIGDVAPAATGLAGGLLSRFKGSKAEIIEENKSEAERRAEEADRAAQNFKAKMDAATAAKEDAQRKALDAAREAEAALKMEAERITEMERAAKAFEEAERLKQDELRRVDEERRAEEARLAEEARRLEEARKREIAAKKEAARKAALERYIAALDITRNEEVRLKSRLKDLKNQSKLESANFAVQTKDLKSRQSLLRGTEETVGKRFGSYEKSASKLDVMNADLSMLQSKSETLSADGQAISIRLSQADTDYQKAQQEAEAAMAKAEARRAELDVIRQEESDVSGRILFVSEKLSSQNQIVVDTTEKTQKLQLRLQAAQSELTRAKTEIEALEQALGGQAEKHQNLRLEIEATQQAIEDSQVREAAHHDAIEHLQAGGAPEDISEIEFETRNFEASSFDFDTSEENLSTAKVDSVGFKDRMMGRVRSTFSREKDASISIDVEDVVLETVDIKTDFALLTGLKDTPSLMRRHGSSLMVLGAVIGGIAIMGGGYALNTSANSKLEVKSSTPAPTQVVSAVTKIELPATDELRTAEAVKEAVDLKPEDDMVLEGTTTNLHKTEAAAAEIDIPKIETVNLKVETSPVVEEASSEAERIIEDAKTSVEAQENDFTVQLAEVVDPTGFAFELPNMMVIAEPKKIEPKAATKKVTVKTQTPKKTDVKKLESVKTVAVTEVKPKIDVPVNYPELTSDIQTRLFKLGFYNGEIDGLQGPDTKEAIKNFKTLFSMVETDDKITGGLLTELKRAEHDQEIAQEKAVEQAKLEAELAEKEVIQLAEVAPVVEFYDTVEAVPSVPVVTDSLPAAESTPAYIAPEPEAEPVKIASIPDVIEPAPTPVEKDIIVEAKMIQNASAKYPEAAERREYYVNVAIVVGYDIDDSGRATNLTIKSNDHSGRYIKAFEKEAMRAIEKLRYDPKTINGVAVETSGRTKRIVFRAE